MGAITNLAVQNDPTLATVLLPTWLGMYALFFLVAPIDAYLSYRTLRPLQSAVHASTHADVTARRSRARRS